MINSTVLVGRLTRDPELRKTGTGKSVVNFTVACNRRFGNQDEADFITCVAWEHTADFMANYLNQGSLVGIEGRIQTGSYEDRETGKTIYTTDVVVDNLQSLESRKEREKREGQPSSFTEESRPQRQQSTPQDPEPKVEQDQEASTPMDEEPVLDITSDDLPF